MRQETINVYQFNELSDEAKSAALDNFRNDFDDVYQTERLASYEAAELIYNKIKNINDEIQGVRLYKWLVNNIVWQYDRRQYVSKHTDGSFKISHFEHKYDCVKYKVSHIFSGNGFNDCPLTGVCYDADFLKPIIDFIQSPDLSTTNIDLFCWMPTYESVAQKDYDYMSSDEYITDAIEANEYEFTEDGKLF